MALALLAVSFLGPAATVAAPSGADAIRRVRILETAELGVPDPGGLAFSRRAEGFLVLPHVDLPRRPQAEVLLLTLEAQRAGSRRIAAELDEPLNLAFDNKAHRLLLYQASAKQLLEVRAGRDGVPDPGTLTRIPAQRYAIEDARGMTVDPVTGRLFFLDAAGPGLVVVEPEPDGGLPRAAISALALRALAPGALRGLAFDPASGHLHVLEPATQRLYEISPDSGRVVANRDLSALGLRDPRGMVFAPSGDGTDDPLATSLYVAEGGGNASGSAAPGRISELSLSANAEAAAATTVTATWVQTIDTSQFNPPSPDAMGIAYIDSSDTLLMSDSELNEIPSLFTGDNVFEIDYPSGTLLATASTMAFSTEPVGVAYNPANGHVFISHDDGGGFVYEVDPGNDGSYFTADDSVASFRTGAFGSGDPEGITFDRVQGFLYIADGVDSEVYEVDPGSNGVFDGVPPAGDDRVSHFDTAGLGARDPEAITYDTISGNLYVLGNPADTILEITTAGELARTIDISAADPPNPSGLAYGPGSLNPALNSVYISDRGVDNDSDPKENDGQIFEVSFSGSTPGNQPPVVDAGPDQTVTLPDDAVLDGTVSDDPAQTLSVLWIEVSGPGTVSFADASVEDTTASFSAPGTYVLRLTANDGELSASDETSLTVMGTGGSNVLEVRVSASSDDAEEEVGSGIISLSSSDLELVFDHADQTVGMRFNGVTIPTDASIAHAYVQFQVDETSSVETSLTVRGEAVADAATFTSVSGNISARPTTTAAMSWSPPPWPSVGEAGLDQRTPDLAAVIAEIVALPGWSSGNSLVILVTGSGDRTAESFDGSPAGAPMLHVEYTTTPNDAPTVDIEAPSDGASFDEGDPIGFTGTASDTEDGNLTGSLSWSSSLDGTIGMGGSFSRADLAPGVHTITAAVTDSGGRSGSAQVTLTVTSTNTAPTVSIDAPPDGSSFDEGTPVTLSGTATDFEDGDLSENLVWSSDLDGTLGTGASLLTSSLSGGEHVITAVVTDSGALGASDTIMVLVNGAPSVSITAPPDGASFNEGESVTLTGTATDLEDGNLSASLSWSSDLDGALGTGATLAAPSLSAGVHRIDASVVDSSGLGGSDAITLTVNVAPSVSVTAPPDGASFNEGESVTLTGTATDPEEGDLSGSLAWSSDRDGALGTGETVVTSSLSAGVHLITASVVDSGGLGASDTIALTLNGSPTVTIVSPLDGVSVVQGQPVTLTGTAIDVEQGDLSANLRWVSSKQGSLGSGASITVPLESLGKQTITATATDSGGAEGSDEIQVRVKKR